MRFVFLGSERPQVRQVLAWLIEHGFSPSGVVIPDGGKDLGDFLKARRIPQFSLSELSEAIGNGCFDGKYKALAGLDAVVSFMFAYRVKEPLLSFPDLGCYNFHPAPLPGYRGVACSCRGLLDDVEKWGVTCHLMSEDFDTGDIVRTVDFRIDPRKETSISLQRKTLAVMFGLFKEIVPILASGARPPAVPQQLSVGKYTSLRDLEDFKKVTAADSPEQVDRKIRAFWYPPRLGAFIELGGQRFTLVNQFILEQIEALDQASGAGRNLDDEIGEVH